MKHTPRQDAAMVASKRLSLWTLDSKVKNLGIDTGRLLTALRMAS